MIFSGILLGVFVFVKKYLAPKAKKFALALVFISAIGFGVFLVRPSCVPIPPETLHGFTEPLETRDDRDGYLRVFQKKNNQWYQCKMYLSRALFF